MTGRRNGESSMIEVVQSFICRKSPSYRNRGFDVLIRPDQHSCVCREQRIGKGGSRAAFT